MAGAIALVGIAVWIWIFRNLASGHVERYMKRHMQRPFVSIGADETAEDEKRIAIRKNL